MVACAEAPCHTQPNHRHSAPSAPTQTLICLDPLAVGLAAAGFLLHGPVLALCSLELSGSQSYHLLSVVTSLLYSK